MKMFDEDALAIAHAVRDVIEGRIKKEVAEPEAKGEKDFKDAHTIDKEDDVEEAAVKVIPEKLPSMNRDEKDIADTLTKAGLVYGKVNKFDSGKFIDPKTGVSITIMRNGNAVAASSADGGTLLSPTDPSNLKAFLKKRGLIESPAIEEASKELGYTDVEEGEDEELEEADQTFELVDMDEYSAATAEKLAKKFKLNVKVTKNKHGLSDVDVTGSTANIKKFLNSLPQESVQESEEDEELSAKQKKYQDFFKKALAKFGAKSPQDLDKEKRAEFFDYIDKNYEGDDEVAEDSAPMVEAPSTVIHAEMPFQLFDKAGTSMMFNLSKDWNVNAVAQSNDRYVAFAGEPRDLEKMLKNHPKLKGKVDVKAIMSTAVKFTGKEKFGRQKGANFTN